MPRDPVLALKMDAFALAQRAKVRDVARHDVDRLVIRATRLLDMDDPLRAAVLRFARGYHRDPRNATALAGLGRDLADFIDALNVPLPPDLGRKDIHG